jgi:hypothetical protein
MAMRDSSSRAGKVNRLRLARLCVLPATAAVVLLYLGARQGFLIVGIDKLSPSVSPKAGTREPQSSSHSHDRENVHLVSSTDIHAEPEVTEKSDFVKNVAVPTAAAAQSVQKDRKRLRMHQIPNDGRPPFREVVHRNGTILGDVSDLLDFAIIGFGKCGTTTLKSWLDRHPEIQCYPHEVYALAHRQPQELLRLLYYLPEGNYKRGYKSPFDLVYNYTMPYFRRYFPKTPLIVGIRHPVLWFQVCVSAGVRVGVNMRWSSFFAHTMDYDAPHANAFTLEIHKANLNVRFCLSSPFLNCRFISHCTM